MINKYPCILLILHYQIYLTKQKKQMKSKSSKLTEKLHKFSKTNKVAI